MIAHPAVFMIFSCCLCSLRHRAGQQSSIRDGISTALTTADLPAHACRTPPDNDIARRAGLLQGFSCLAVSCGLWWRGFLPCAATTSPGGAGRRQGFSWLAVSCGLWWRGFLPCAATTSPGGPGSYRGVFLAGGVLRVVGEWPPSLRRKGFARRAGHPPSFVRLACCVACRSPAPRAIGFPGMLPFRVSSAAGDHPENHSPAKVFVRFRPRVGAARPSGPSTSPR